MKELNNNYTAPTLEVLEIQVEQGFALSDVSDGGEANGVNDGSAW